MFLITDFYSLKVRKFIIFAVENYFGLDIIQIISKY
jgi:hypothetical protein